MKRIYEITLMLLITCVVSCEQQDGNSTTENDTECSETVRHEEDVFTEPEILRRKVESREEFDKRFYMERRSGISYHADNIIDDAESGRITLTGNAWYNGGGQLLNGTLDPASKIVIDRETLRVIETKGKFQSGGIIMGLAK